MYLTRKVSKPAQALISIKKLSSGNPDPAREGCGFHVCSRLGPLLGTSNNLRSSTQWLREIVFVDYATDARHGVVKPGKWRVCSSWRRQPDRAARRYAWLHCATRLASKSGEIGPAPLPKLSAIQDRLARDIIRRGEVNQYSEPRATSSMPVRPHRVLMLI